jgi:hypothetical protein
VPYPLDRVYLARLRNVTMYYLLPSSISNEEEERERCRRTLSSMTTVHQSCALVFPLLPIRAAAAAALFCGMPAANLPSPSQCSLTLAASTRSFSALCISALTFFTLPGSRFALGPNMASTLCITAGRNRSSPAGRTSLANPDDRSEDAGMRCEAKRAAAARDRPSRWENVKEDAPSATRPSWANGVRRKVDVEALLFRSWHPIHNVLDRWSRLLDEISVRDQRCTEPDYRPVQSADEHLGMFEKGLSHVDIASRETIEPELARFRVCWVRRAGNPLSGQVGTS